MYAIEQTRCCRVTTISANHYYYCTMKVYEAVKRMRELSKNNIPFSITFLTCNTTKEESKGVRHVRKCLLRTGLNEQYSDKARSLIGYVNLDTSENKTFYIPLLLRFNNIDIDE